jgi:hypothetical protein
MPARMPRIRRAMVPPALILTASACNNYSLMSASPLAGS